MTHPSTMPTCSAVQPHETASHDTVSATVSSVLLLAGLFVACVFFPIAGSNLHAYQHHIASHRAISPNTHTSVKELRTSGFNGASSLLLTAMRHIEKEFYVSKTNGSTGKQSAGNGAPHIKSAAVETADGKKSSLKNTASKSSVKDEAAVKHVTENDAPEVGPKATAATAKIKISPNDQKVKVARDKLAELYRDKENNLWRIGEHALDTDKELGDGKAIELAKELHIAVGTIANLKSVAKRVPAPLRNEQLSWDHHRLVAKIKDDKLKEKWLDWAADNHKTTRELADKLPKGKIKTNKAVPGAKPLLAWLTEEAVPSYRDWDDERQEHVAKELGPILAKLKELSELFPAVEPETTEKSAD